MDPFSTQIQDINNELFMEIKEVMIKSTKEELFRICNDDSEDLMDFTNKVKNIESIENITNTENNLFLYTIYFNMGKSYVFESYAEAAEYIERARSHAYELMNYNKIIETNNLLAIIYTMMENFYKAIDYYMENLNILLHQSINYAEVINLYYKLSEANFIVGNLNEAQKYKELYSLYHQELTQTTSTNDQQLGEASTSTESSIINYPIDEPNDPNIYGSIPILSDMALIVDHEDFSQVQDTQLSGCGEKRILTTNPEMLIKDQDNSIQFPTSKPQYAENTINALPSVSSFKNLSESIQPSKQLQKKQIEYNVPKDADHYQNHLETLVKEGNMREKSQGYYKLTRIFMDKGPSGYSEALSNAENHYIMCRDLDDAEGARIAIENIKFLRSKIGYGFDRFSEQEISFLYCCDDPVNVVSNQQKSSTTEITNINLMQEPGRKGQNVVVSYSDKSSSKSSLETITNKIKSLVISAENIRHLGRFNDAISLCDKALDIAKKQNNIEMIKIILFYLQDNYRRKAEDLTHRNFGKSNKEIDKLLQICHDYCRQRVELMYAIEGGKRSMDLDYEFYEKQGRYHDALLIYKDIAKNIQNDENNVHRIHFLIELGETYYGLNQFDQASEYYKEAELLNSRVDGEKYRFRIEYKICQNLCGARLYKAALPHAINYLNIAIKNGRPYNRIGAYHNLLDICVKLKDNETGYKYAKEYIDYSYRTRRAEDKEKAYNYMETFGKNAI